MAKRKDKPAPKIVSSAHLAGNRVAELSEFEFALTPIFHAYGRWIVRCTAAAGQGDLSPLDVLILHHTNHRDRAKTLADLALVLNVEDDHLVNYGLKKLKRLGLVAGVKQGKEVHWGATQKGRALCDRYRAIRETCLVDAVARIGEPHDAIAQVAALMRALSGLYDQASRSAATL
jgi:predicted MarR family transcription regulator